MKKKPIAAKSTFKKVRHDRALIVRSEGNRWTVDAAEWRDAKGRGELRVYRIEGDITNLAALKDALQAEADARGLAIRRSDAA
jgi:hypothetical protein